MNKKTFFNYPHPEAKPGEIFVTNAKHDTYDHIKWKTKRMGIEAFDCDGNRLVHLFPVFVQESEINEKYNIVKR